MPDLEKLLSQMTLYEKISMLAGRDLRPTIPVPPSGDSFHAESTQRARTTPPISSNLAG